MNPKGSRKWENFHTSVTYHEMMSSNVTVSATLANMREGVNTTNTICICKSSLKNLRDHTKTSRIMQKFETTYLIQVSSGTQRKKIAILSSHVSSQQTDYQNLQNWHRCHLKQSPETHLFQMQLSNSFCLVKSLLQSATFGSV